MSKTLRYDLRSADEAGNTEHWQRVMKSLGYKLIAYEPVTIADCIMIEVEKIIEPLPGFLKVVDYKIE